MVNAIVEKLDNDFILKISNKDLKSLDFHLRDKVKVNIEKK